MIRSEASTNYPGGMPALLARLQEMQPFASICADQAPLLERTRLEHVPAGEIFVQPGESLHALWIHLSGHVQLHYQSDTGPILALDSRGGELMGEIPALSGSPTLVVGKALQDSVMLRFEIDDFWQLMTQCHPVRQAVIGGIALRIQKTQFMVMQREKMIAIGTASAGLMHELNNPSAAAQSASAQLRKNLLGLQEISLRFCDTPMTPDARECLRELQQQAYAHVEKSSMSTLEESEREEQLAEWLSTHNIDDAFPLASTLAPRGLTLDHLECAASQLEGQQFSDALHWLGSLSCSLGLLQTVEDSVARINMLVNAVKVYSSNYGADQPLNLHDTIKSAFMVLLHKIRFKQIRIEKRFAAEMPLLRLSIDGVPQLWTNLIDNAIDAVAMGGKITVTTRLDGEWVEVIVQDDGSGIPGDIQGRIFEPFFTTKSAGSGNGFGLDIVQRKVQQCGGSISVESEPGNTRFIVRLPFVPAASPKAAAANQ